MKRLLRLVVPDRALRGREAHPSSPPPHVLDDEFEKSLAEELSHPIPEKPQAHAYIDDKAYPPGWWPFVYRRRIVRPRRRW